MSSRLHTTLGDELYAAWHARAPVAPLSSRPRRLSLDDAYRIQQRFIERRIEHGEAVVGKKIGVTSQAVQDMLNVRQPDFGILLSGMHYAAGEAIAADTLARARRGRDRVHPRARPARPRHRPHRRDRRDGRRRALLRDRRFAHPRLGDPHRGHRRRQRIVRRVRPRRCTRRSAHARSRRVRDDDRQERRASRAGPRRRGARPPADAVAWREHARRVRRAAARRRDRAVGLASETDSGHAGDALSMHISGIGSCDVRFI